MRIRTEPLVRAFLAVLLALPAEHLMAQTTDLVSTNAFRVCADPASDPISMEDGSGYENAIAELMADSFDLPLEYEWYPMATGFIRNTLQDNRCDVVIGYAQGHELVLNTNHWMVSTYVLVVPSDGALTEVETLSDPALKDLRVGVIAGSPPATHMARNGLMAKAEGYDLVVDSRYERPIPEMLEDLSNGEIDAAVAWGPIAGPLVKRDHSDLTVIPLVQESLPPRLFYRITMGVRQGEQVWKRELNSRIRRHQEEIDTILRDTGVPLVTDMGDSLK